MQGWAVGGVVVYGALSMLNMLWFYKIASIAVHRLQKAKARGKPATEAVPCAVAAAVSEAEHQCGNGKAQPTIAGATVVAESLAAACKTPPTMHEKVTSGLPRLRLGGQKSIHSHAVAVTPSAEDSPDFTIGSQVSNAKDL